MIPADFGSNCETSCVISCPSGWEREGERCYLWTDDWKTWFEAEETCKTHDGHLASVTDQHIHDYMMGKGRTVWIGGVLADHESTWVWTDCSDWDFNSGWKQGEPNNFGWEKCVAYHNWDGNGWNDLNCDWTREFVCSKMICLGII